VGAKQIAEASASARRKNFLAPSSALVKEAIHNTYIKDTAKR
jgi:hypothetical protein